jgi:asparagine synthase (glutamine-hydrolysing)
MCGIAGFIDYNKSLNKNILLSMVDSLSHRGPDDKGVEVFDIKQAVIGFGQTRLSIIDLSEHGHQPMKYDSLVLTYNGEVYNFKAIKKELIQLGYSFFSDSDTEVILKSFHAWRERCVEKFIGMFAFAIFDSKVHKVYFFRDRVGIKPLYIAQQNDVILFSSEVKSFLQVDAFQQEVDLESVALFLQYNYISNNKSIYKNVYKLEPATCMVIDLKTKNIAKSKYWDVDKFYKKKKIILPELEVVDHIEKLLVDAAKYRLISDVPVGIFLSGGYDSSTLTALLQKNTTRQLKTFTIGFNESKYNEAKYAKEIARHLGTDHHEFYINEKDTLNIVPQLCEIYDEPFGDTSAIPMIFLSNMVKTKVSVALSADGGDEIFAGYNRYLNGLETYNKIKSIPLSIRRMGSDILNTFNPKYFNLNGNIYNFNSRYQKALDLFKAESALDVINTYDQNFSNQELEFLLKNNLPKSVSRYDRNSASLLSELEKMQLFDYKTFLQDDVLVKVDRATMSAGLEGREPFLDHNIIEFVAQVPDNYKLKNNSLKYLLKSIAHKHIPKELLNRQKMGFSAPVNIWLQGPLRENLIDLVNPNALKKSNIFDINYTMKIRDDLLAGKRSHPQKLWQIFIYQQWHDRWIKG